MDFPSLKLENINCRYGPGNYNRVFTVQSLESNENAVVENFFSELNKFEESLQDFYRRKIIAL